MNFVIDKQKAEKKWAPILEHLSVQEPEKREWMSEYAEYHKMNENVSYGTLSTHAGMGNVLSPQPSDTPGSVWGADAQPGSGDVGQNLLPISMKIAAQTIGLDLVSVKPAASPKVDLLFVDFRYDDQANDEDTDRPLVFKVASDNISDVKDALYAQMNALRITEMVGGLDKRMFIKLGNDPVITADDIANFDPKTADDYQGWMEFLGFSRVDGFPMFRIFRQSFDYGKYVKFQDKKNTFPSDNTPISTHLYDDIVNFITFEHGSNVLDTVNFDDAGSIDDSSIKVELVSTMEDHIPGFSAGWNLNKGMNRDQAEKTYPGQIGPNVFTKTIQVGEIEITSALKRTEIEDIKASTGMDIVQKLESVLINELSQVISKEIVENIKRLGELNRNSHTTPKVGTVSKFDFDVDQYLSGNVPQGETTYSLQRKIATKINNASNYIANEGRVGPAQYIVTNGNIASVIQDITNNVVNPPVGGGNLNTNGQLYPVGKLGNMTIYVDPYMRWDDNRIFLGRKNTADEPGLIFLPYLMAQSISLISEATWAPRMLIRSRYSVADIGFFPEKQFMALHIKDIGGYLA